MTEPQIFGTHEPKTLDQLRDVASRAERAALMADGHLGYVMPIGGVAAYRNQVSVVGVGFDIACGNAAIRTDLTRAQLVPHLSALADTIQDAVSFGMGRKNRAEDAPSDDPLFEDPAWDAVPGKHERERLRAKARDQLGTVGSGNHYVDVFADEAGASWSWCTTTTTSPGRNSTVASASMWCSRVRRPRSPARRASSAARWGTTR